LNKIVVPARRQTRIALSAGAGVALLTLGGCAGNISMPSFEMPSIDLGLSSSSQDTASVQEPKTPALPQLALTNEELMKAGTIGDKALGKKGAPVTVIEYASLSSPAAAAFHTSVFPMFKKAYIDTGKVYYIYRDFPDSTPATIASAGIRCAPPTEYFKLTSKLYMQQATWSQPDASADMIYNVVKEPRFKRTAFDTCIKNQNISNGLAWVQERGRQFGVTDTPAFFINGQKAGGGMTMEQFQAMIDPLLTAAPTAKTKPGKGKHA
jgi:protein-disulfide isomerase